jgi:eukaryotic-like serine/threonine-protein kinase
MSFEPNPTPPTEPGGTRLRFGPFDLDLRCGELTKSGVRVRLQSQPCRVLALLARHPGRLLTRDEIRREVWPDGYEVDFEQALNFSIRQIRAALQDQAQTPRFVETLPRRGYRFIAPVEVLGAAPAVLPVREPDDEFEVAARRSQPPAPARPRQLHWLVGLALGVVVGGLAVALWPRSEPEPPRFSRLTFRRGTVDSARFAPDGQVVFTAVFEDTPRAVYAARTEGRESHPLPLPAARLVAISRQGEASFIRGDTLARAPLEGGPAKDVLENVTTADATSDGTAFAVARRLGGGRASIEYPVGTVLGEATMPTHLRLSPAGDRLAFLEHSMPGDDRGMVVVLDRSGRRKVLTDEWASIEGLAWAPRGDALYFTAARVGADCALHVVRLDGRVRTLVPALGRLVVHDVGPDGRVLLERNTLREEIFFQRDGESGQRDLSWYDLSHAVALSPDGGWLLFAETGEGGGPEYGVYLRKTDGSPPVRLGHGRAMGLSPDGRFALAIPVAKPDHIDVLPMGPGEVKSLRFDGLTRYEWAGFLPDGRSLLFTARRGEGPPRVYRGDLSGGASRPITPEGIGLWRNAVSPDGTSIIVLEGMTYRLYPTSGGESRGIPGLDAGFFPAAWSGPNALLLREWGKASTRVERLDLKSGQRAAWRDLDPRDRAGLAYIGPLAITPDEKAWAFSVHRRLSDLYVVDGLR